MFQRIRAWIAARLEREDDESDRWFLPSSLDFRVREAHAGGDSEIEREIANINRKAEMLDDNQHEQ